MTRIAPATLSVVAAALSTDSRFFGVTNDTLNAALLAIINASADTSADLNPGEFYLVVDTDRDDENEEYRSYTQLQEYIKDCQEEMEDLCRGPRDFDDRYSVYIVRKTLNIETERTVTVLLK